MYDGLFMASGNGWLRKTYPLVSLPDFMVGLAALGTGVNTVYEIFTWNDFHEFFRVHLASGVASAIEPTMDANFVGTQRCYRIYRDYRLQSHQKP